MRDLYSSDPDPSKTSYANPEAIPKLSVILPVFEEQETIGVLIRGIIQTLSVEEVTFEVIAVDDGSRDGTLEVLRRLRERYPDKLRVVRHIANKGNGAALRTGVRVAHGEVAVFMDADGQHAPEYILRLASLIPPYDLVIGTRTSAYQGPFYRTAANHFYNWFASWLSQTEVRDLTSGFRAMRRSLVQHFLHLFPSGFSAPTTITLAFLKAGYNVAFEPITVRQRTAGKSKIRPWRDGTRFVMLTLRMIMLYDPLRIFLPSSMVLGLLGVAAWIAGVANAGRLVVPNSTIFLFTAGLMTWLLGLVSGQVADGLIFYHGDETVVFEEGAQELEPSLKHE